MSSDEHSNSSSDEEEEDVGATGLIATRAKRSTAGNLYESLRANLDDEELQKELLAEEEDDQGDYEGSEKDDDDDAMDSSSDEEDAGPPKDGEAEDLEGEKELKKQERAANRKKRKMDEAKMRLPAWQKKSKRVKLADDVKTLDGSAPKPKKKSERSNWLPIEADMPVRQSSRASAIANREIIHTNLKESALRSEKQKRVMANHAERSHGKKRADLTQEQRLEKAARIERETAREFGRWEREEAERQRIREEQLAAKRKRGIDGPVIRHWSGSVLWEGDKIKNKRLHGSVDVDQLKEESNDDAVEDPKEAPVEKAPEKALDKVPAKLTDKDTEKPTEKATKKAAEKPTEKFPGEGGVNAAEEQAVKRTGECTKGLVEKAMETPETSSKNECKNESKDESRDAALDLSGKAETSVRENISTATTSLATSGSGTPLQEAIEELPGEMLERKQARPLQSFNLLDGIQEYAAQNPQESLPTPLPKSTYTPSAPAINAPPTLPLQPPRVATYPTPYLATTTSAQAQLPPPQIYHGWPPSIHGTPWQKPQHPLSSVTTPQPPAAPLPPLPPPPPLIKEQAQRSLIMLEQFERLEHAPTSRRASSKAMREAATEPTPIASVLIPLSYPSFTPEQSKYLTAKMKKVSGVLNIPPAPEKTKCALTSWPAKFRDPKTGLPYSDLQTYKMIQRMLAGGCQWSSLLGAWSGPHYGAMGRAAAGVPDGFAMPASAPVIKQESTT